MANLLERSLTGRTASGPQSGVNYFGDVGQRTSAVLGDPQGAVNPGMGDVSQSMMPVPGTGLQTTKPAPVRSELLHPTGTAAGSSNTPVHTRPDTPEAQAQRRTLETALNYGGMIPGMQMLRLPAAALAAERAYREDGSLAGVGGLLGGLAFGRPGGLLGAEAGQYFSRDGNSMEDTAKRVFSAYAPADVKNVMQIGSDIKSLAQSRESPTESKYSLSVPSSAPAPAPGLRAPVGMQLGDAATTTTPTGGLTTKPSRYALYNDGGSWDSDPGGGGSGSSSGGGGTSYSLSGGTGNFGSLNTTGLTAGSGYNLVGGTGSSFGGLNTSNVRTGSGYNLSGGGGSTGGDSSGGTNGYADGGMVRGGPQLGVPMGPAPDEGGVAARVQQLLRDSNATQRLLARPLQLMQSGELTPDEVLTMGRVAEAAMYNPSLYPQLRQFVMQQGMTPLPPAYDPSVVTNIMVISKALQAQMPATQPGQVPGMGQAVVEQPVPGFGNGGMIRGPGTGRSDSIGTINETSGAPVKVSTDEYIIPAHVVRAKGRDFFDGLLRKYTPMGQE